MSMSMMSIAGNWDVSIATPIGTQRVVLELTERAGKIEGPPGARRRQCRWLIP